MIINFLFYLSIRLTNKFLSAMAKKAAKKATKKKVAKKKK